jgi:hypothetical protein
MQKTIPRRTRVLAGAAALATAALVALGASAAGAAGPNERFGFAARDVSGRRPARSVSSAAVSSAPAPASCTQEAASAARRP